MLCGGDAHVLIKNLLCLLRLRDLEDKTFTGKLRTLLSPGLFKVMDLHDAEIIGLNSIL